MDSQRSNEAGQMLEQLCILLGCIFSSLEAAPMTGPSVFDHVRISYLVSARRTTIRQRFSAAIAEIDRDRRRSIGERLIYSRLSVPRTDIFIR